VILAAVVKPPGFNFFPGLPRTIQPIELAWTAVALLGMYFSGSNWLGAREDRRDLLATGRNGLAELYAHSTVFIETIRFVIQALIVEIGGVAMLIPPETRPPDHVVVAANTVIVLFAVSIALTVKSWYARRVRIRAKEIDEDLQEAQAFRAQADVPGGSKEGGE
jgi:hypothetical protein